jgi:hypothetical protein
LSPEYLKALVLNSKIEGQFNWNYNSRTEVFIEIFLAEVSNTYSYYGVYKKLNLVIFLEYFQYKLNLDDREFIKKIIAKCDAQSPTSEYQSRRDNYNNLLAQARQEQLQSLPTSQRAKIDKEVIVGYDLDELVDEFRRRLNYEGAFAFSIYGHFTILENYIIKRILQELQNKTQRPYIPAINLQLYQCDSDRLHPIEYLLQRSNKCQQISDLFCDASCCDVVLVIWNYDIPKIKMESIATEFWRKTQREVIPYIQDNSRCLIVIFANVDFDYSIDGDELTTLTTPNKFETTRLLQWFRGRLRQLELEDGVIMQCLSKLESQHGHLVGTYQKIQEIIDDIQGKKLIR